MSAQLKVVNNDEPTEFEKQLERINRPDFVKKELTPPHFPDASEREVSHGTLKGWFARLRKPAVDNEQNVKSSKK